MADPLAAALAASGRDASVARGTLDEPQTRAADVWTSLNRHLDDEAAEETETEEAEEVARDGDSDGVPSPAAVAARRRKMNITAHRKPNATTVAWDEEEEEAKDEAEDEAEDEATQRAEAPRSAKRKYNKWSTDEIEALKGLVGEFGGAGKWREITLAGKQRGEFKEHLHPSAVRDKWKLIQRTAARK